MAGKSHVDECNCYCTFADDTPCHSEGSCWCGYQFEKTSAQFSAESEVRREEYDAGYVAGSNRRVTGMLLGIVAGFALGVLVFVGFPAMFEQGGDAMTNIDLASNVAVNQVVSQESQSNKTTANVHLSFDDQLNILVAKGYPSAAGMTEEEFKNSLEPLRQDFREGSLIIIPRGMISLENKFSRIELNGKQGFCWLINPEAITDLFQTPDQPYLIHDIEDGQVTKGLSPLDSEKKLQEQSRRPLTANEGLMLLTCQPQILNDYYIYLSGSRYGSSGWVPGVWLSDGWPRLLYSHAGSSYAWWGSPSCGSR